MKNKRQKRILEIINQDPVRTQGELAAILQREGINVTQATVSRDIKELRIVKAPGKNGKSKYAANSSVLDFKTSEKLFKIFKEAVTSFDYAQNIVVIHTMPGLAMAACSALDGMKIADIVGTIAGDDTAFILMREVSDAIMFCDRIKKLTSG